MDLAAPDLEDDQPLLLYDGSCGFCQWCVRFVLRQQSGGDIRFASLASPLGRRVSAQIAANRPGVDSIVWLSAAPRGVATESSAVLAVLSHLGGFWRILGLLRIIPRPVRNALYRLVARYRHRLGVRGESCPLPTPTERRRFVGEEILVVGSKPLKTPR